VTSPLTTLAACCRDIPVERTRLVGVYFLIANDEIVYVGQSEDVETRISQHVAERTRPMRGWYDKQRPNLACKQFDRAIWFPVAAVDLDAYEGALIRALNPLQTFSAPISTGRDAEVLAVLGLAPNVNAHRDFLARRKTRFSKPRVARRVIRGVRDRRALQRARRARLFAGLTALLAARAS